MPIAPRKHNCLVSLGSFIFWAADLVIWENGTKIFLYMPRYSTPWIWTGFVQLWCPYNHVSRANFFVLDTFPSKTVAFERSRQVDIICTEELDVTPSSYWDIATQSSSQYILRRTLSGDISVTRRSYIKFFGANNIYLTRSFECNRFRGKRIQYEKVSARNVIVGTPQLNESGSYSWGGVSWHI